MFSGTNLMKKISIFLSSTFADFQKERDIFTNDILPYLNKEIAKMGLYADVVDLRWGIDTNKLSEKEKNKKVLLSCINEIDKSEPFFVSLLGNRYGWVPSHNDIDVAFQGSEVDKYYDKSVTQIEIEYTLNTYKDQSKCLFLFRDNKEENADDDRLSRLKKSIEQKIPGQVIHYEVSKSGEDGNYQINNDFIKEVVDRLVKLIKENFEDFETHSKSYETVQIANSEIYKSNELFSGRKEYINEYKSFINSEYKFLHLIGESGFGKSYLLSKYIEIANESNIKTLVFYPASSEEASLLTMFNILACQLGEEDVNFDSDGNGVLSKEEITDFIKFLNKKVGNDKTIIFIDAINQLRDRNNLMLFVNQYLLNENIKIVFSSTPDCSVNRYLASLNTKIQNVNKFNTDDIKYVFANYFKSLKKEVPQNLLKNILNTNKKLGNSIKNPLFLQLFLNSIAKLNEKDYLEIRRKESELNSFDKALKHYQIEKSKNTPNSIKGLIINLIQTFCEIVPTGIYYYMGSILFKNGFTINDMEFVLKCAGVEFSHADYFAFLNFNKEFIYNVSEDCVDYKHNLIKDAVFSFATSDWKFKEVYDKFVQFYLSIDSRVLSENNLLSLISLALKIKDYKFLSRLILPVKKKDALCSYVYSLIDKKDIYNVFSELVKYDTENDCCLTVVKNILLNPKLYTVFDIDSKLLNKLIKIIPDIYKKKKGLSYNLNMAFIVKECEIGNYLSAYKQMKAVGKKYGYVKTYKNGYKTKQFTAEKVEELQSLIWEKTGKNFGFDVSIFNYRKHVDDDKKTNKINLDEKIDNYVNQVFSLNGFNHIDTYDLRDLKEKLKTKSISSETFIKGVCVICLSDLEEFKRLNDFNLFNRLFDAYVNHRFTDRKTELILVKTLSGISDRIAVKNDIRFSKRYLEMAKEDLHNNYSEDTLAEYTDALRSHYCNTLAIYGEDEALKKELIIAISSLRFYKKDATLENLLYYLKDDRKFDGSKLFDKDKYSAPLEVLFSCFRNIGWLIIQSIFVGLIIFIPFIASKIAKQQTLFQSFSNVFIFYAILSVILGSVLTCSIMLVFIRKFKMKRAFRIQLLQLIVSVVILVAGLAFAGKYISVNIYNNTKYVLPPLYDKVFISNLCFAVFPLTAFISIIQFFMVANNYVYDESIYRTSFAIMAFGKTKPSEAANKEIKYHKRGVAIAFVIINTAAIILCVWTRKHYTHLDLVLFSSYKDLYRIADIVAIVFACVNAIELPFILLSKKGYNKHKSKNFPEEVELSAHFNKESPLWDL